MADIDWSNIPREVIAIDTLGPPDVLFVGYFGEDNGPMITIVYNTYYVGMFDGDLFAAIGAYNFTYLVLPLSPYEVIDNGLYYTGASNGFEVVPHPFELPPIAVGQLSGESFVFIPFHCDDTPPEYWG